MNKRLDNVLRDVMIEYKHSFGNQGYDIVKAYIEDALLRAEKIHDEDVTFLRGQVKQRDHIIESMEKEARAHKPHKKNTNDSWELGDSMWDEVIEDWSA